MAEGNNIRGRCYVLALEDVFKPYGLGFAVRAAVEEPCEYGIGIQFVLCGIKADKGYVSHPHGKVSAKVPVSGAAFFWLAVHPHILQVAVGPAAAVVVSGAEHVRNAGAIILSVNLRLEEDLHLSLNGFFRIGGVSVPDDT